MMDFLTGERRERQVSITSQRKETRERQTDRQREKKRKESTSIGIFDWLLERERGGTELVPIRNGARDSPVSCWYGTGPLRPRHRWFLVTYAYLYRSRTVLVSMAHHRPHCGSSWELLEMVSVQDPH